LKTQKLIFSISIIRYWYF